GRLVLVFVGMAFVRLVLRDISARSLRVFLFGSKAGVAGTVARELARRCPAVQIAGCRDGYRPQESWATLIDEINRSSPDVLLVALGNPLQETWIANHLSTLRVQIAIGVGALFDYLAGEIPRAPKPFRRVGLEWFFRL